MAYQSLCDALPPEVIAGDSPATNCYREKLDQLARRQEQQMPEDGESYKINLMKNVEKIRARRETCIESAIMARDLEELDLAEKWREASSTAASKTILSTATSTTVRISEVQR